MSQFKMRLMRGSRSLMARLGLSLLAISLCVLASGCSFLDVGFTTDPTYRIESGSPGNTTITTIRTYYGGASVSTFSPSGGYYY